MNTQVRGTRVLYSLGECAEVLGVSLAAARRMAGEGELQYHWRVRRDARKASGWIRQIVVSGADLDRAAARLCGRRRDKGKCVSNPPSAEAFGNEQKVTDAGAEETRMSMVRGLRATERVCVECGMRGSGKFFAGASCRRCARSGDRAAAVSRRVKAEKAAMRARNAQRKALLAQGGAVMRCLVCDEVKLLKAFRRGRVCVDCDGL